MAGCIFSLESWEHLYLFIISPPYRMCIPAYDISTQCDTFKALPDHIIYHAPMFLAFGRKESKPFHMSYNKQDKQVVCHPPEISLGFLTFWTETPLGFCIKCSLLLVRFYNFSPFHSRFAQSLHRKFSIFCDLFVFVLLRKNQFTFWQKTGTFILWPAVFKRP